ncbi:uncharacterized protein BDV14DRAFT_181207 [Aspergillus stella-maris]|uniref:uncharacterized protein n=1 Tax=Aspergillus stella-maris TaxID=1810926 RepID=UPI003CCD1898
MSLDTSSSAPPNSQSRSLFQHESWTTPWSSPDFPPDESLEARYHRFKQKPWWGEGNNPPVAHGFLSRRAFSDRSWPWGFVIYRTTYASEEDWAEGIAKLNRHFDCCLPSPGNEAIRLVREGLRNVIIDDISTFNGASVETVLKRHQKWVVEECQIDIDEGEAFGIPRFEFCLMIDEQCLRSILHCGNPVPGGDTDNKVMGYVNILDMEHNALAEDYDEGPFHDGCFRLDLDQLWQYPYASEDRALCDLYKYRFNSESVLYIDGWGIEYGSKNLVTYTSEMDRGLAIVRTPVEYDGERIAPDSGEMES